MCEFFQRYDGGNCVTILHSGHITPQKSGLFLDIMLGLILPLTQLPKAVTD